MPATLPQSRPDLRLAPRPSTTRSRPASEKTRRWIEVDEATPRTCAAASATSSTSLNTLVLGQDGSNVERIDVLPAEDASFHPAHQSAGSDGNDVARTIGPGVSVVINVNAGDVLGSGDADGKLLGALRGISAHLRGGTGADAAALRGSDLSGLDGAIDGLLTTRAQIGATANRLESAGSQLAELQESANALLSETEDADMAKTLIDFFTQQAVYQSALRAGANVAQSSLLDFLR